MILLFGYTASVLVEEIGCRDPKLPFLMAKFSASAKLRPLRQHENPEGLGSSDRLSHRRALGGPMNEILRRGFALSHHIWLMIYIGENTGRKIVDVRNMGRMKA
jgi:hypothetical protein